MRRYLVKRFLMVIPTLFIITFICFGIINLAPGDVVTYTSGVGFQDPEIQADRREALGLDKSFLERYTVWLSQVARGDLGTSYLFIANSHNTELNPEKISDIIMKKLPYTLLLNGATLIFSFLLCILISVILATGRSKHIILFVTLIMYLGMSIPDFLLITMIKATYIKNGLATNWIIGNQFSSYSFIDFAKYAVIPVLVLCITTIGYNIKYLRNAILEVKNESYIIAARSRGICERVLIWKHVLRNSLLPLITAISLSLPTLVGGSIIVETVWGWPGIGQYIVMACYARDYPLLMGTFLIASLLVVGGSILADIAYAIADPRITYE